MYLHFFRGKSSRASSLSNRRNKLVRCVQVKNSLTGGILYRLYDDFSFFYYVNVIVETPDIDNAQSADNLFRCAPKNINNLDGNATCLICSDRFSHS